MPILGVTQRVFCRVSHWAVQCVSPGCDSHELLVQGVTHRIQRSVFLPEKKTTKNLLKVLLKFAGKKFIEKYS